MAPITSTERVVQDLLRFVKRMQVELDTLDPNSKRAKDMKDCLREINYYSEFSLGREPYLFEEWKD